MQVSLKDIAEKSGCSVTTVSRVLNHKGVISAKTRAHVLGIAEQLGYHENRLVKAFQEGRTWTVGICMSWDNKFFSDISVTIVKLLAEKGFMTVVCYPVDYRLPDGNTDQDLIHRMVEQRVDGIIIVPRNDLADDVYFSRLVPKMVPVVTIDRKTRAAVDYVGTDDFLGGYMTAKYFYSLGRKNIGYIKGPDFASTANLRKKGMTAFAKEHPDVNLYLTDEPELYSFKPGQLDLFFQTHPDINALSGFYDWYVSLAGRYLLEKGYRIPEDISLMGFGNLSSPYSELMPMSTIDQHPELIAQKAVERLLLRINSKEEIPAEDFLIRPTILNRSTTIKNN